MTMVDTRTRAHPLTYPFFLGNGNFSCLPKKKGETADASKFEGDAYCKTLTASGFSSTNSCCAYFQLTKIHNAAGTFTTPMADTKSAGETWNLINGYPVKEG